MQLATRGEYEGAQEENNTHRGKAGVLATAKARVGAINLKEEPGQQRESMGMSSLALDN